MTARRVTHPSSERPGEQKKHALELKCIHIHKKENQSNVLLCERPAVDSLPFATKTLIDTRESKTDVFVQPSLVRDQALALFPSQLQQ